MQTKFLISLLVILLSILTVKNTWDFYYSASNNSLNNILRKSVIEQSEKNSELLEKNKNLENEIRSMQNNIGFAESYSRENLDMLFPNEVLVEINQKADQDEYCLLYTSPSPRDLSTSRMPSSA